MSSTEVKTINLHKVDNPNFVEYTGNFNKLLVAKPAITTALKPLTDQFAVLLDRLEQSLVAVRGNSHTQALNEADDYRDMIHSGFVHMLYAYQHSGDEAKMSAASNLIFAAKQYGFGTLRNAGHNKQTALMDGLMETLKSSKHTDDVTALPEAASFMTAMQSAMDNFKQVKDNKAAEASTKLDYTTRDVRAEIIPVYRKIIGAVEAMAEVGAEPQYAEFISEVNGLIDIS